MLGRRDRPEMPATATTFEGKSYLPGATYRWEELPPQTRREARAQSDDIEIHYGRNYRTVLYRLVVIPAAQARERLDRWTHGRVEEMLASPAVRELTRKIRREGLSTPPILEEGAERAAALVALDRDVPYFDIAEPVEEPGEWIPTLDGRPLRRSR